MKKIFGILICMLVIGICIVVTLNTMTVGAEDSNLVAYWKFDEGSGTTTADSSGNGNNGLLYNGPKWVDGIRGKALSFDGIDDYVEIDEKTDLNPHTSDWTISLWINIKELGYGISGDGFIIINKRQSEYDQSLTLMVHDGEASQGKFAFMYDGSNIYSGAESNLMNIYGWHHIAGVRSNEKLFVYVDGMQYGPNNTITNWDTQISASTDINSSTPIMLGYHGEWNSFYNGIIDEVRIYNRALTQQEIQLDMGDVASINETPVASFTLTPSAPKVNQTITFDASTSSDSDGSITKFEWDWDNDGIYDDTKTTITVTHSWAQAGSYPVTLRVTDNEGATNTKTLTISISSGDQTPGTTEPKTPGFELIIVICAIAMLLLWKRKRK